MKIAIIGSRDYPNEAQVRAFVDTLDRDTIVYSGGARGVDKWADEQCVVKRLSCINILPNYDKYGPNVAPLERNKVIVEKASKVVAFWDGKSTGTIHACKWAKKLKRPVEVYRADGTLWPESVWSK